MTSERARRVRTRDWVAVAVVAVPQRTTVDGAAVFRIGGSVLLAASAVP